MLAIFEKGESGGKKVEVKKEEKDKRVKTLFVLGI